jgi:D-beta-D-heptose 7-phosphate kinase/D-beta-D-heptose 1-phosphate adenosyltransferase
MQVDLSAFKAVKIVVVGDVMLDRYWHGGASRISPEAPVPVVHVRDVQERPGGAGNVALNLRALGCEVGLFGLVGQDEAARTLSGLLQETGVSCYLAEVQGMLTITKLRVIDRNQQLLRLDFEQGYSAQQSTSWANDYKTELNSSQAVILSDYGKGTLSNAKGLINAARQQGIPVLVDPKSKDFSLYQGASVITPNLKEFEAIVGVCKSQEDIAQKGFELIRAHQLGGLLVTRGEHGMTLLCTHPENSVTHLPAHVREVYDVTGAGDTVISVLAAALAIGQPLEAAAYIANMAAGLAVRKFGAATVSVPELRRALQREQGSDMGILTEEEAVTAAEDARAHKEKVVMTNGCFDILHAGHIMYLEQAKALGDRLIVAVNTDDSVSRLKGPTRPINSLQQRMAVLAALRAVDWVVSFSEDTPQRIISRILPNVLVKGGDYKPDEIAGAECVKSYGGKIEILGFVEGCSTSGVIRKITGEAT